MLQQRWGVGGHRHSQDGAARATLGADEQLAPASARGRRPATEATCLKSRPLIIPA
jgi:hypothetical protein